LQQDATEPSSLREHLVPTNVMPCVVSNQFHVLLAARLDDVGLTGWICCTCPVQRSVSFVLKWWVVAEVIRKAIGRGQVIQTRQYSPPAAVRLGATVVDGNEAQQCHLLVHSSESERNFGNTRRAAMGKVLEACVL
jgi:hypothetical protein